MKGIYKVSIKNSRNSYVFELKRNITILCGDSGKGKTTLYDMIHEYNRFGKESGVSVSSDRKVVAISGDDWESDIKKNSGAIIVIDEDSRFIRTVEFAGIVKDCDNYFLLITRNYLRTLPYSVDEIYTIKGAKSKRFAPVYQDLYKMYDRPDKNRLPFLPEVIIAEDSNSGFSFFKQIAGKNGIECVSAQGKSNILKMLKLYAEKKVAVIADGAAFGCEISDIVKQQELVPNKLAIFLPESFEWLILKAGIINEVVPDMIEAPYNYADSSDFMSWKQYFTDLLVKNSRKIQYKTYSKNKLADYYLQENNVRQIKENIKGMDL